MTDFDRILVPLDGSPTAESVLDRAQSFLARPGVEVVLFQAIEESPLAEMGLGESVYERREHAEASMKRLFERLARSGIRGHLRVQTGPAANMILAVSEQEKASLIALATHGRSGLGRWMLGSVAEKVIRASRRPVLLFPAFERDGGRPLRMSTRQFALRKILVPLDRAPSSLDALDPVIALAKLSGALILLLHVLGPDLPAGIPVAELGQAYERCRDAGCMAEPMLRSGDAASQIVDIAGEAGADLIAMTTHGRSGVARWALGSVTEKVVRGTAVPLLLVSTRASGEGR